MNKMNRSLAVTIAVGLLIPSIASALGLSIVSVAGPDASGTLQPGETVTFDLVLENDSQLNVLGIGAFVDGYDSPDIFGIHDGGLVLQSGQSAVSVFDQVVPNVGTFTPLTGVHAAPFETFEVNNLSPNPFETTIFEAVSLGGSTFDGQLDTGIAGNSVLGGVGDVHFRLTYVALPISSQVQRHTLNFNLIGIGAGGILLPATGDTFSLTVIPEPGTALLMALGLFGLAAQRGTTR